MNKELNQIKKIYGEEMMHLCRELFPSLLEQEGVLLNILKSNIAPTRSFASDIKENCLYDEFKSFVYSFIDVEEENNVITDKTPFELMDEAGYKLYECKSEEDIQSFRKYYAPGEVLCTITNGGRLERCHVFFAVKKNVDKIKRENFNNPKREDEYGTSVISIQFSRGAINTLSIKNRYNHSVNNPDATFSNNLDNIIPGLKNSFENYYNLNIDQNNQKKSGFLTNILKYTRANDGRYYRYNVEVDGAYYCENNIIVKEGRIITDLLEKKERYLLIDQYVIDRKNKMIYSDSYPKDSFIKSINEVGEIECINVTINNGNKNIDINYTDGKQVKIETNRNNAIIGYENNYVSRIEEYFLYNNTQLNNISLAQAQTIEGFFLYSNTELSSILLTRVEKIGNNFLFSNKQLNNISLPEARYIGDRFLYRNEQLSNISLPKVEFISSYFLYCNTKLKEIILPEVQEIEYNFLFSNKILQHAELPRVKYIGTKFLYNNEELFNILIPSVESIGDYSLYSNKKLKKIYVPNLENLGYDSFNNNTELNNKIITQIDKTGKWLVKK